LRAPQVNSILRVTAGSESFRRIQEEDPSNPEVEFLKLFLTEAKMTMLVEVSRPEAPSSIEFGGVLKVATLSVTPLIL